MGDSLGRGGLTLEDVAALEELEELLPHMTPDQQAAAWQLVNELQRLQHIEEAQHRFLPFVEHVWPEFIRSGHHEVMSDAFEKAERGEIKRLMINMAPRHTKSEFASHLFPSWCLGKVPSRKIMQCSNTGELAVGFGRKVRNLVNSEEFAEIFPKVELSGDSKAAGRWSTNRRGEYFASGVGGVVTGRGADILIIDDPHSEQEAALNSLSIYDNAYEWYKAGPRQRLQPGGVIVIVATRWHKADLCGRLLHDMVHRDGDEWHVIELPAILDEYSENERPIWPSFWKIEELQATRNSLDVQKWQAQYQQKPVSEEGALVKREWWNKWERDKPPQCKFVIQSWDTAFTAKQTSDYSACSTWGVWEDEDGNAQIILLDAYQARMEFHELKQEVLNQHHIYKPDAFLVEAKASGWPLIQELRRLGIPVTDVTPVRGQDKLTRVNAITDIFASGRVWAPDTKFADLMVEQFAEFPYGEHDDLLDTGVMALTRFREGGFITLPSDEIWDTEPRAPRVANYY